MAAGATAAGAMAGTAAGGLAVGAMVAPTSPAGSPLAPLSSLTPRRSPSFGAQRSLSAQLLALGHAPFWRQHRPLLACANAVLEPVLAAAGAEALARAEAPERASASAQQTRAAASPHISPYLPISPQQTRAAVPAKQSVAKEARGERLAAATAFAQECAVARLEACLRLLSPPDQPPGLLSHAACEIAPLLSVAVADWMREAAACVPPEGA